MPPARNYPTNAELIQLVREHGSILAVARFLDVGYPTLSSHIRRMTIETPDLREQLAAARTAHRPNRSHLDARGSINWPEDDELVALIATHGTIVGAAQALGCAAGTLRHRMQRQGIAAPTPGAVQLSSAPVDDPFRLKVDQLKAEVKALRRENGDYSERLASQEAFFDRIVEATKRPVEPLEIIPRRTSSDLPKRSAILPIYDMQFGQLVRAADTPGGKGTFSLEVFDDRMRRYIEGTKGALEHYAASYQLSELVLVFGGDQVEGDEIFSGQAWQLELDPPRQVWELAGRMEAMVRELVEFARNDLGVEYVLAVCVPGNHGKVGGRKSGARPATYSWDWLLFKLLEHRCSTWIDDFVIEAAGSAFFYAAGQEFQAVHGDQIRGWGGIPFYGLQRFDARSVRLHNRLYRYLLMGHHHQAGEIPQNTGAETIISGDWVGANNLSGIITAASRPQQKILYVAEKWGITSTERIYLTDDADAYEQSPIHGRSLR